MSSGIAFEKQKVCKKIIQRFCFSESFLFNSIKRKIWWYSAPIFSQGKPVLITGKTCFNHRENRLSLQGSCSPCREHVFKTGSSLHAPCSTLYGIAVYLLVKKKIRATSNKNLTLISLAGKFKFVVLWEFILRVSSTEPPLISSCSAVCT